MISSVPLKGVPKRADMLCVGQQIDAAEALVTLRAERDERLLSWDVHPDMAASMKARLEAEGWKVWIRTGGPTRRRLPRIERHVMRWAP